MDLALSGHSYINKLYFCHGKKYLNQWTVEMFLLQKKNVYIYFNCVVKKNFFFVVLL